MLGDAIHPMAPFKGQVCSQNALVQLLVNTRFTLAEPGNYVTPTAFFVVHREQIKHCLMVFFCLTNSDAQVCTTEHLIPGKL